MIGKHVGLALAAVLGGTALAAPALAQNEQFIPALVYRTGACVRLRRAVRQRHCRLLQAGERARRRHQRRQAS